MNASRLGFWASILTAVAAAAALGIAITTATAHSINYFIAMWAHRSSR